MLIVKFFLIFSMSCSVQVAISSVFLLRLALLVVVVMVLKVLLFRREEDISIFPISFCCSIKSYGGGASFSSSF